MFQYICSTVTSQTLFPWHVYHGNIVVFTLYIAVAEWVTSGVAICGPPNGNMCHVLLHRVPWAIAQWNNLIIYANRINDTDGLLLRSHFKISMCNILREITTIHIFQSKQMLWTYCDAGIILVLAETRQEWLCSMSMEILNMCQNEASVFIAPHCPDLRHD